MLPINFLNQTCKYSLKINGVIIQARVVENYQELVDSGVAELRSRLDTSFPIVGFDLKHVKLSESERNSGNSNGNGHGNAVLLVLHVKDQCLVLKLTISPQSSSYGHSRYHDSRSASSEHSVYHESLLSFLKDESICFLGWEVSEKINLLASSGKLSIISNINNVGSLATRVLKIRELERCFNLVDLAGKVGAAAIQEDEASQIMKKAIEIPYYQKLDEVCFTEEEVKYAVLDAYRCYTIGTKLMNKP